MVHGYVFLDAATGAAEKLPALLDNVEVVREAHVVAGDHDVVAEVETEGVYDVLATVTEQIRPLDGVESTRTYVALE